jgi:hypothetical protein
MDAEVERGLGTRGSQALLAANGGEGDAGSSDVSLPATAVDAPAGLGGSVAGAGVLAAAEEVGQVGQSRQCRRDRRPRSRDGRIHGEREAQIGSGPASGLG